MFQLVLQHLGMAMSNLSYVNTHTCTLMINTITVVDYY